MSPLRMQENKRESNSYTESGAHVARGHCFLWFLQIAFAVSCCVALEGVEAH